VCLMIECDQEMNESMIYRRRDSSFVTARDNILSNKEVEEMFNNSHEEGNITSEMKDDMEEIYKVLLTKVINARFGAELKKVREHKFSPYAGSCSDS